MLCERTHQLLLSWSVLYIARKVVDRQYKTNLLILFTIMNRKAGQIEKVFLKKGVRKYLNIFHLYRSVLFSIKLKPEACNFMKKETPTQVHKCFPVN